MHITSQRKAQTRKGTRAGQTPHEARQMIEQEMVSLRQEQNPGAEMAAAF